MPSQGREQRQYRAEVTVIRFIGTLRFISHPNNSNGMRACIPARIREKPGPFTRPPTRARIQLKGEGSGNETSLCVCVSVCLSVYLYSRSTGNEAARERLARLQRNKRSKNNVLKRLRFGKRNPHRRGHVLWPNPSISAVRMRIYYTIARLARPLACFRTVLSATRVCSYIPHGSCCRGCVSQLLARAAPVAYTNRVCAEGLHFSAFHSYIFRFWETVRP